MDRVIGGNTRGLWPFPGTKCVKGHSKPLYILLKEEEEKKKAFSTAPFHFQGFRRRGKAKEENEGDENEEIEENEEDDECELGIEDPRYVAEKALLQELFFPEALKVPPDDDASKKIFSLPCSPPFFFF